MERRCIICNKPIDEDKKIPVCEYHRRVAKDNAKKVAKGAVQTGAAIVMVVPTGVKYVKDHPEEVKKVTKKASEIIKSVSVMIKK